MKNDKKFCVLCEAEELGEIEATYFIKIDSGDLIPVCESHYEELKHIDINPFGHEQSDE